MSVKHAEEYPETKKLLVEAGYDLSWVVRDGITEDGLRLFIPKDGNGWFGELVEAAVAGGWTRPNEPFSFFTKWFDPEVGAKIWEAYSREVEIYG